MIRLRDVSFAYHGEPALFDGLTWTVDRGSPWSVVGPSGAGKTTLLHLIAGLLRPTAGSVEVDGKRIPRPRPRTGVILQHLGLMPWARIAANVQLGLRIRRFYGPDGKHAPADWSRDRATMTQQTEKWLRRMGLWEKRLKYPIQLSGGERQRVAIARTMTLEPDLLLMDEPFSSLDLTTRRDLHALVLGLEQEVGHTRVIVTHDVAEAAVLGRHILVLGTGGHMRGVVDNPAYGSNPDHAEAGVIDRIREMME